MDRLEKLHSDMVEAMGGSVCWGPRALAVVDEFCAEYEVVDGLWGHRTFHEGARVQPTDVGFTESHAIRPRKVPTLLEAAEAVWDEHDKLGNGNMDKLMLSLAAAIDRERTR